MHTFHYEVHEKWFGLRSQARYVTTETGNVLWLGRWRWGHNKALDDVMSNTFDQFMEIFASTDKEPD